MPNDEQVAAAEELLSTFSWAVQAHEIRAKNPDCRFRSSLIPFSSHISDVVKTLNKWGISLNSSEVEIDDALKILQLGTLHDTIEDTTVTKDAVVDRFGLEMYNLILQVTSADNHESREQKWCFLHGFMSEAIDHRAVIVKIADRYSNVKDYADSDPHYAAFYALQAFPLYERWSSDCFNSVWPSSVMFRVGRAIWELSEIIRHRYSLHLEEFDMEGAKKLVTK